MEPLATRLWRLLGLPAHSPARQGRKQAHSQFPHDGTQLASASIDKTVRFREVASGGGIQALKDYSGWARAVVFSPDGTQLASASNDETVRL